jgi:hypothetical protein
MADAAAVAAYRRALTRAGQSVRVQRWTGQAPNKVVVEAIVMAFVQKYAPDATAVSETNFSASKQGAITQTERHVILLACDLEAAGFPTPMPGNCIVKKNDKVVVQGETLNVDDVDPNTRVFVGALDLTVVGV